MIEYCRKQFGIFDPERGGNEDMCRVSVIVPVYNVEKYLPACLNSVLGQTLEELELIAINDASPDGCGKILDEYAERDRRVRVIHLPENHMQGYGRNRGLEIATGKYVYFLDSDDMITPEAMEELYCLSEEEKLDVVFFDSDVIFETEKLKKRHGDYPAGRKGYYSDSVLTGTDLMDLFCEQNDWLVYVQRQFWRRELLIENGIANIEGVEHEDEFFSFAATICAKRAKYVNKKYFLRRYREDSVMTREAKPKDFHGYFITYCEMLKFADEHGLSSSGVEYNLMHMYECITNFQDVFESTEDPRKWFSALEYEKYRLFKTLQLNVEKKQEFYKQFWKPLDSFAEIWIYGAGRVATSVAKRILSAGYAISGFFVTDPDGNPEMLYHKRVQCFDGVRALPEDSVIVVAVGRNMHAEIASVIEKKGIPYFLYAQNLLSGPFMPENKE